MFANIGTDIQGICNRFSGKVGIAVKALNSKESFVLNGHLVFPAASTIKIYILLELFNQINQGKHKLNEYVTIAEDRRGEVWSRMSSGILKDTESIKQITLKDAATLMMVVSDNVATNLLIDLLCMEMIQNSIDKLGLENTKLQRKMMDLESAKSGRENVSTPYDMMITFEKIAGTEIPDTNTRAMILDILSRTQTEPGLRMVIPESVTIEHKTGEIFDVCNDVGIVRLPRDPFVICVMTKGETLAKRWDTIAQIGKTFFDHLSSASERKIAA